MALRIVEVILGPDVADYLPEVVEEITTLGIWNTVTDEGNRQVRILTDSDQVEKLMDSCQEKYGSLPEFRLFVLSVEATLPRREEEDPDQKPEANKDASTFKDKRISREELYYDLEGNAQLTSNFITLVVLSTIVASLGLLRDNVAVVIGAMVIAPLLGPNMALALATLIGDPGLALRGLKTISVGIALSVCVACLIGFIVHFSEAPKELSLRTKVDVGDIVLALCSGAAGALSFTSGLSSAVVGVMVAVALLPPLSALGLLLAHGDYHAALGAGLLFLVNLTCINLSGIGVFWLESIRPDSREREKHAQKLSILSMVLWTGLLALLIWVIVWRQGW